MSRPWMPWYIGDYLRDTTHLTTEQHGAYLLLLAHCWQHERIPLAAGERAAIVKLTPNRWKAICEPVERFFNADGTQKRVTKEIEKTERAVMQRTIAGTKGGQKSAISRAISRGKNIAIAQAKTKLPLETRSSENEASATAGVVAESKQPRTNHNSTSISSSFLTAEEQKPGEIPSAGLLATARLGGALARPPEAEQAAKRPADATREDMEAIFERRRAQQPARN